MYAITLKSLSYNLGWSFILGILGVIVDISAGVLMCVGRNINTTKKRKKRKKRRPNVGGTEDIQMDDNQTKAMKVWSSS